jgi:hypothetical protein
MSVSAVGYVFSSWNCAIIAAGLKPYTAHNQKKNKRHIAEAELMEEVIRLTGQTWQTPF